jgi:hypothetical protein
VINQHACVSAVQPCGLFAAFSPFKSHSFKRFEKVGLLTCFALTASPFSAKFCPENQTYLFL